MENILGLLVVVLIGSLNVVNCLDNGLARTPPMGWMSWQRFRCITDCKNYPDECISEKLYTTAADYIVSEGYKELGYEYVIIDDCWMEMERGPDNRLVPDRVRFPNGMKYVADYIHSKGLKFGLYENYGTHTCAGYPGVIDHMELDAKTFFEWNVDYVKLDGCYVDIKNMDEGYPEFGRLLNLTGRPMVYSCSWPVYQEFGGIMPDYEALKKHCNLWRNYGDIDDSWESVRSISEYFSTNQERIQPHGGPGHWNDPDMLVIGNFGLSYDQAKAQMAIWAILAAPLIMSNDLANMKQEFTEVLQNKGAIEVNQDRLGIQGKMIKEINNIQIWTRPVLPYLHDKYSSLAVAFISLRTDGHPYPISVDLKTLGLEHSTYRRVNLFDVNENEVIMHPTDTLKVRVNPSGVVFYKFTPKDASHSLNIF